jgi:hypothetical protein
VSVGKHASYGPSVKATFETLPISKLGANDPKRSPTDL